MWPNCWTPPYSEQYALFQEVSESLMTHSISNPQIYSISLVSDTVHYSNLYTAETLDSFREALTSSQPAFLGVKSSDFRRLTNFPEKDFLIFGAPILLNGREVGATILSMRSVSILSYDEEENEMGSYYVLCRDDEGAVRLQLPAGSGRHPAAGRFLRAGQHRLRGRLYPERDAA